METIDTIRKILNELEIDDPVVDVHYDEQKNIIGFVCSDSFSNLNDADSQRLVWKALKQRLGTEQLVKILGIFHETPHERRLRINGDDEVRVKPTKNRLWIHDAPMNRYWMVVDVGKFGDEYKAIYLIINGGDKFQTGLTFVYTHEIIEFMQLEQEEIYDELFSMVFENAESKIKLHIMNKYDELTKKGQWGRENIYSYVFKSFKLIPHPLIKTVFDENELRLLKEPIDKMDDFKIKNEIKKRIKLSEMIIKNKQILTT